MRLKKNLCFVMMMGLAVPLFALQTTTPAPKNSLPPHASPFTAHANEPASSPCKTSVTQNGFLDPSKPDDIMTECVLACNSLNPSEMWNKQWWNNGQKNTYTCGCHC